LNVYLSRQTSCGILSGPFFEFRARYNTALLAGSLQKAIEGFGQSVKNLGQQIGEVFKPTPTPANE
jgi:hypothetical protein